MPRKLIFPLNTKLVINQEIVRTIWKHIECSESFPQAKVDHGGYQQDCSVNNATLNRFFSLHFLLP
jgi:hypothetical protein